MTKQFVSFFYIYYINYVMHINISMLSGKNILNWNLWMTIFSIENRSLGNDSVQIPKERWWMAVAAN